jgi:hypothetical protein
MEKEDTSQGGLAVRGRLAVRHDADLTAAFQCRELDVLYIVNPSVQEPQQGRQ